MARLMAKASTMAVATPVFSVNVPPLAMTMPVLTMLLSQPEPEPPNAPPPMIVPNPTM